MDKLRTDQVIVLDQMIMMVLLTAILVVAILILRKDKDE